MEGCMNMREIKSTMTGTVLQVKVSVGDKVGASDELAILESMKMEIPVESQGTGVVKEIKVNEGDFVDEGDILIILE